jgi:hypothetical protein
VRALKQSVKSRQGLRGQKSNVTFEIQTCLPKRSSEPHLQHFGERLWSLPKENKLTIFNAPNQLQEHIIMYWLVFEGTSRAD